MPASATRRTETRRLRLALELILAFFGLPAAMAAFGWVRPLIPILLLVFGVCLAFLLRDRSFDRRELWNPAPLVRELARFGPRFLTVAATIAVAVYLFDRPTLFDFPRRAPAVWALVMLLYPLLSVYPQELVFRAFVFHRYRGVFGAGTAMVWASALAFGWVHILFENWLAVALTVPGGWLFADTYRRSRSLLAVSVEHSLYGCFVFTVGLGRHFYNGM